MTAAHRASVHRSVMSIPIQTMKFALLGILLSCLGCTQPARTRPPQSEIAPQNPGLNAVVLPGQRGPSADLRLNGETLRLTTHRTDDVFPDGNSVWAVELHRDSTRLASWKAASGIAQRQTADRLWSPGNAAPLPAGIYRLGAPEPWGNDLWFDLHPRFDTTRSALGIHRCFPGTGCICIPDRDDIEALASWVRKAGISELTVTN